MAPRNSTTVQPSTTVPTITPDLVRAYADYLETGATGSILEFAASEAGQTAARAMTDQKNAELRGVRMSWARAVARDFKINGRLTTYSRDRAMLLRDYLGTVDFDKVPEPTVPTTDEPETTEAATPAAS